MRSARATAAVVTIALIGVAAPRSAHADGSFLEGAGGLAVPFIDDHWRKETDPTLKVGGRIGHLWSVGRFRLGVEALLDASVIYGDHDTEARGRLLAGPRLGVLVTPGWLLFARGDAGFDRLTARESCDNLTRYALEVGLGLTQSVGKLRFGGQVNLPVAFRAGSTCPSTTHVSHDFDFLFSVAVPL